MQFFDTLRRGISAEHKQSALRHCLNDVTTKLNLRHRRKRALPWYFVLGLPQSGRTSLLQHEADSHWQHIASFRDADADGGAGCDWWLAEKAVVVDVHGRFAQSSDTHHNDSWSHFLELLQRFRKQDAASAAILVISAADLQHNTCEQKQKQVRLLRQQLKELQLTSRRRIACFVVISKCDVINGFTNYFAALSAEERRQVWGITLTAGAHTNSHANELAPQLATLQNTVHGQLPQRLQSERDAVFRRGMVALPPQFDALGAHCTELCAAIFPDTQIEQTPTLRGIYFTANKDQAGRYFTDRLFSEVILADAPPTQITRRCRFSSMSAPRVAAFAGIATAMVLLLAWCYAFIFQCDALGRTRSLLQQHASSFSRHENGKPPSLTQANAVLSTLDAAAATTKNNATWIRLLGMHDGSLEDAIHSGQQQVLERQWLPALTDDLLQWLFVHGDNTDDTFNALKAWLMLVDPAHRDIDYLSHWFEDNPAFELSQRDTISSRLQQLHRDNPQFSVPFIDLSAVRPLQQKLASVSPQDRIYAQWKVQFQQGILAIKPLLGTHIDAVFDIRDPNAWNVPLLYTADAFGKLRFDADMPALTLLEREQWVLGDAAYRMDEEQRAQIAQALRQRYLNDYAAAWRNLFNAISLHKASDTASLIAQLQLLADNAASPLTALLRISEENTKVLPQQQLSLVVAQDKVTALSTTLTELKNWLGAIYQADNAGSAALQTGNGELLTPPRKTLLFSEELPTPVSQWVATLAHTASNSVANAALSSLDSAWRQQVGDFCRANIGGHYPFAPRATATASYNNFVDYFRPGGIEDNFVRSQLNDVVSRDSWSLKPGAPMRLSPATLAMLARAQKIRSAFFHSGDAGFSYRITPLRMSANLQRFAINIGTARFEYSHGPRQATQFSWPQDSTKLGTEFTSLNGNNTARSYDGVWGLYRLIDIATQFEFGDSNSNRMVLHEGPHNIELTMTPATPQQAGTTAQGNPLQRDLLTGYDCIAHLR